MNRKYGILLVATAALAASALAAGESGLKPGDRPGAFQVVDVTGPNKGKQLCYRCQYGMAPVVAAFVNGDAAQSAKLVAGLQKLVDARRAKGLQSFVVYMSGPESKDAIQKIAAETKSTIPLVLLPRGTKEDDIAAYKISPSAKTTVLLWKGSFVKSNFVNLDTAKLPELEKAVDAMLK